MKRLTLAAVVSVGIGLSGCGLNNPDEAQPPRIEQASVARASATLTQDKRQVIAAFAESWSNWTVATLPARLRRLLTLAAGRLATELRLDVRRSNETRFGGLTTFSRGRLVGVIPSYSGHLIVVAYEQIAPAAGVSQGSYQVYIVKVERVAEGWRLTEWQPATDS